MRIEERIGQSIVRVDCPYTNNFVYDSAYDLLHKEYIYVICKKIFFGFGAYIKLLNCIF
jgi:hypothetical protein